MVNIYIIEPHNDFSGQFSTDNSQSNKCHRKKHQRFIIDGRKYNWQITYKNGAQRLKCNNKECKGRRTYKPDGTFDETKQVAHNECTFDPYAIERQKFLEELMKAVRISNENSWRIFNQLRKNFPAEMALDYSYYKNIMKKEKTKVNPPMPRNLEEMANTLSSEPWKKLLNYNSDFSGKMEAKPVPNYNPSDKTFSTSIVFTDKGFIQRALEFVEDKTLEGFSDATFSAVPKTLGGKQFLIIQISRFNHGVIIAYALMERKTKEAYQAVCAYIFNEVAPELKVKLKNMHTDFEIAEQNGFTHVIPDLEIVRCEFHYEQAQTKNARKNGALKKPPKKKELGEGEEDAEYEKEKKIFDEVKEALDFIRKFPYLPADMIDEELVDFIVSKLSEDGKTRISKYIDYFKGQWLVKWKPEEWSVFEKAFRTNNFCESRNRDIYLLFKKHPTPWQFVRALVGFQDIVAKDFEAHKHPKAHDNSREKKIRSEMDRLKLGKISRMDYLRSILSIYERSNKVSFEQYLEQIERENEWEKSHESESSVNTSEIEICEDLLAVEEITTSAAIENSYAPISTSSAVSQSSSGNSVVFPMQISSENLSTESDPLFSSSILQFLHRPMNNIEKTKNHKRKAVHAIREDFTLITDTDKENTIESPRRKKTKPNILRGR